MAQPNRLRAISQELNRPLDQLIPGLINELGTIEAVAHKLGVTGKTIFRWLQQNGYKRQVKVVWTKNGKGKNKRASTRGSMS